MLHSVKMLFCTALVVLVTTASVHAQIVPTCCECAPKAALVPCESDRSAAFNAYQEMRKAQRLPKKLNSVENEKTQFNSMIQAVYTVLEGTADPIATAAAELVAPDILIPENETQITVECRILTGAPHLFAPQGFTPENGWMFVPKPDKSSDSPLLRCNDWLENRPPTVGSVKISETHTSTLFRFVDESNAQALLSHLQGDPRANLLQAPKITMFNGQFGTIVDISQTPYRASFFDQGKPETEILNEGMQITLSPKLRSDDAVHLQYCSILFRKMEKMEKFSLIPTEEESEEKMLQIPKSTTICVEIPVTIPKGKSLLLAIPGFMVEAERPQPESGLKTLQRDALALLGLKPLKDPPSQREKQIVCVMITPRKIEPEPVAGKLQYTSSNLREVQEEWERFWLLDQPYEASEHQQ